MISLIFSTNRKNPMFYEWFLPSLCNQTNAEERSQMECIFISYDEEALGKDYTVSPPKIAEVVYHNDLKIIQTTPKKSLYQGPTRKSKTQMFSPSSARNTGIILSRGDYLVFCDDVSILMPGWWAAVWQGYVNKRIVCGSYWKKNRMDVAGGCLISDGGENLMGRDSRWTLRGADKGPVLIPGTQMFGCSFGIPAKDIIQVNGFDELCDSIGGEDYHLGVRLNHAGKKIYYDKSMFTVESEELHNQPHLMWRDDRVLPMEEYNKKLYSSFSVHKRVQQGARTDSSHMLLDILYGTKQTQSRYNFYNIEECRSTGTLPAVPEIHHHWFDDKPLAEL